MEFTKIQQPQSFRDHAYEEIKNAIINHEITQGEVLFERNLSEKLGISRTPLRSAIQLLEFEGWLKSVPRKGVFVSHILEKDVEEVLQLRRANESLVIELLIPKITNDHIERIEQIYRQQEKHSSDNQTFILMDKDFHMNMAELTGNDRLIQLMHTLSDRMRWFGIVALNTSERVERTLKEHWAIIERLKKRDVEFAKQAMIEHIQHTRTAVLSSLKSKKETD